MRAATGIRQPASGPAAQGPRARLRRPPRPRRPCRGVRRAGYRLEGNLTDPQAPDAAATSAPGPIPDVPHTLHKRRKWPQAALQEILMKGCSREEAGEYRPSCFVPECGGAGYRDLSTLEVCLDDMSRAKWVAGLGHSPIIVAGGRRHLGNIRWRRAGRVLIVMDDGR